MKKILICILTLSCVFMGYSYWKQRPTKATEEYIIDNKEKVKNLDEQRRKITKATERQMIINDKVNFESAKNQAISKIESGFNSAYNDTKTEDDYQNLKKLLPNLIGKSASAYIISMDKPTLSQNGKKMLAFDKLDSLEVGTGKYNYINHTLPIFVSVKYESPITTSTVTGGAKGSNSTEISTRLIGYNQYRLTYNLKKGKVLKSSITATQPQKEVLKND